MYEGADVGRREEPMVDLETARSTASQAMYCLAKDVLYVAEEERLSGRHQVGVNVLAIHKCQEVALILEGVPLRDAPTMAREVWGDTVNSVREHARTFVRAWERETSNRMLNAMTAEGLIIHLRIAHGVDVTVDELRKTLDSSPHDPARIQLLEYLPGTEAEIRKVLERGEPAE